MVSLTQKAKYALKSLIYLAKRYEKGPVLISDIAESERIPKKFLETILLELKKHGYLQSKKGKAGGYWLIKEPETIYLGHVIRIFEGPLAPIPCVSKRYYSPCEDCVDETTCEIRRVMLEVKNAINTILDKTSVADSIKQSHLPIQLD